MAQHDFNIANQGFPATRADINNAFQAIASNSSGATAPSTTYANMWWYDTTNNKMYLRNEADSAWIEVATIDQTNNEWQITTGVVQAKDSDGLALKTDDGTTRLFIKDSDGSVGIGTTSQTESLSVRDTAGFQISFGNTNASSIGAIGYDNNDKLNIYGNGATRMSIDSSGNVGIGTSSPGTLLDIAETTAATDAIIGLTAGTGGRAQIRSEAQADNTSSELSFHTMIGSTTSERMRIDAVGNLAFNRTSATFASGYGIHMHDNRFVGFGAGNGTRPDFQIGSVNGSKLDIRCGNGADTADVNIDTSGNLQVGFESYASLGTVNTGCRWSGDATTNALARGSNGSILGFYSGSGSAGNISVSGASTSYNTSSDYRLKENVETLSGAITRVKALKPKRFSWIEDGLDSPNIDGFIAHEVQDVIPEAISGAKDAMRDEEYEVTAALGEVYTPAASATFDDDGNELTAATDEVIHSTGVAEPETLADGQLWRETTAAVMGTRSVPDYQGIDQSKIVPLLTAALQEAIAKIEDLETRVAALESA